MDNPQDSAAGDDGVDANSVTSISNLHVKSLSDLARLSDHLPISWPELPRVPFFGPLLGFNDQWYRAAIALGVLETRWRGNRSLTPEEVQIVAGQTAKAVVTMSYEVPALLGTTWLYERRGRATFRFPFYQPGPSFNPDVFPTARFGLATLTGTTARSMWHATRVVMYATLSHWALRTLFISYAMTVKNVEFEREPRLANLRTAIRQNMTDRLAAQRQRQAQNRAGLPLPAETAPPAYPARTETTESSYDQSTPAPAPVAAPQRDYDDLSDDLADDLGSSGFDTPHDDDATPVAPAARRRRWEQEEKDTEAAGGGSAWDRVRSQTASGEPRPPPTWSRWNGRRGTAAPSQPAPPSGDSPPVGSAAWDRQKEQREFDAMLERERRGDNNR